MKNVLATIIGLIVASITVHIFEAVIGHNLFTFPEGAELSNTEWIKNNMDKIPMGSKICVVFAHFAGIITGMFVAAKISKQSVIPSHITGGLMVLATFVTIVMQPKELWFSISDGVFAILGFLIGKVLAQKQITDF
ncbi:hypothetical protein HNV08_07525 [Winogradskyella eckloniae]|uniref:hypothetical protein n=1 Tax=Winogradskyella eckloniae TaxID=1089306 RepID=UPI001564D590|nr:hypothetical protein [Winogradskyella eckloniae]NRD19895.1 hypothetical protein [Winogradskyella eckloniae]